MDISPKNSELNDLEDENSSFSEDENRQAETKDSNEQGSEQLEDFDEENKNTNKKKKKALYSCTFPSCDGIFTTIANRKRHERLHSGDKPYNCDFEGCGKNFARKYDLKVHARTHTKEKPYACAILGCAKKFSRNSSLREHERNIHHLASSGRTKETEEPPRVASLEQQLQESEYREMKKAQLLEQHYQEQKFQEQIQQRRIQEQRLLEQRMKEQRFQEQKMNQIQYHEQKLEAMKRDKEIRVQQQMVRANKSQVNDLVSRFLLAQEQKQQSALDFRIPTEPRRTHTQNLDNLRYTSEPDEYFPMTSTNSPEISGRFSQHVSLAEEEGQQMWDDLVRNFFPPNSTGNDSPNQIL